MPSPNGDPTPWQTVLDAMRFEADPPVPVQVPAHTVDHWPNTGVAPSSGGIAA